MKGRQLPTLLLGAVAAAIAVAGCARPATHAAENAAKARAREAAQDVTPPVYRIHAGDTVSVKFTLTPEFDSQVAVRPDGHFSLPMVGDVEVAGATPIEFRDRLVDAYQKYLKHPEITVNIVTFGSNVAYIGGQVRQPMVVSLGVPTTALRAIMAVGGSLDTGDLRKVVIVRDKGTPEPEIMMLDLSRGLETLAAAEDVWLRPRDMVFVPKTGISQADQFVKEYIRDLLPIQSSFSVQYNFGSISPGT